MHNAQPERLLQRPELFTWTETLFSQRRGGADVQFIKQQQQRQQREHTAPRDSYVMLSFPHHLEFKILSPINTSSKFSVRMTKAMESPGRARKRQPAWTQPVPKQSLRHQQRTSEKPEGSEAGQLWKRKLFSDVLTN